MLYSISTIVFSATHLLIVGRAQHKRNRRNPIPLRNSLSRSADNWFLFQRSISRCLDEKADKGAIQNLYQKRETAFRAQLLSLMLRRGRKSWRKRKMEREVPVLTPFKSPTEICSLPTLSRIILEKEAKKHFMLKAQETVRLSDSISWFTFYVLHALRVFICT